MLDEMRMQTLVSYSLPQNTGASLRNNLPSSFFTHFATAFAALITALFGKRGETAMYSSNVCVICEADE